MCLIFTAKDAVVLKLSLNRFNASYQTHVSIIHDPHRCTHRSFAMQYTATGPCLVEVGTRCHGGEGTWQGIANECVGYNQIDVAFDAYVQPAAWASLPPRPLKLAKVRRAECFPLAYADRVVFTLGESSILPSRMGIVAYSEVS
jgi:hypothetical protein